MEGFTLVTGEMTNKTEKEKKNGLMDQNTKEIILIQKKRGLENSFGPTDRNMKVNSRLMICVEKENINGRMVEGLRESGKIIKWKAMGCFFGLMEGNMKVNT
jgi:hypothetical protein